MNHRVFAVLLLSVFAVGMMASAAVPVKAAPEMFVRNPLTGNGSFLFSTDTTSVGFKFNATVGINEGTDVFSWQAKLTYDPTLLNVTRAWIPTPPTITDPDYIFAGHTAFTPPISFATGSILAGATLLEVAGVTFTTPKKLFIVEFRIMAAPSTGKVSCNLGINNVDTFILDSTTAEIPVTKTDGLYEFSAPAPPANTISISVDKPKVTLGSTVAISGVITPMTANVDVAIYSRLNETGQPWTTLTTVKTDAGGNYLYAWTPLTNATFEVKSGWDEVNSTVVLVTVLPKALKTFDVNGDKKVDIKDISLAATAFGSYEGSPTFNPDYDFNNDGRIDMIDMVLIAIHFGESL